VGEKLAGFLDQSRQISQRCTALAALLAGDEADRADRDLHAILERTDALAGHAESSRTALDRMLAGVTGIEAPLVELNRDMRTFRVLATLIRIESAHLDQAGTDFEALAEEVRKLAADIERNGGTVLTAAQELGSLVRQALPGIAEFEARQKTELPRIRVETTAGLRALAAGRERAARISRDMAVEYAAVQAEMEELVVSLQFHDITRQQIEHVAEALAEAEQETARPALLGRMCGLQRAQLGQSKTAFVAAVERVRQSLEGIAGHVSGMAEEIARLLAGSKESSLLGEMGKGFAGIRATLGQYAESRYALAGVAETVAKGVQEMAGFVDTIEEIGLRMQRIALNANVKAVQMGPDGTALGAVADGIQRLAADSSGQTEAVARGIRGVADRSGHLSEELAESSQDLAGELEQTVAVFQAADGECGRRLDEIAGLGRSLAGELETLRGAIGVDARLAEALDLAMERLARAAEEAARMAPAAVGPAQEEAWQRLAERYTMHAERMVHERAAAEADRAPAACVVASGAALAPELGDNVELF